MTTVAGRGTTALAVAALALVASWSAQGATNDLQLGKLCDSRPAQTAAGGQVLECGWVRRRADGTISGLVIPNEAEASFRSLMSELGAVMAPRLLVPAQTLGYAGFQVAGEVGFTRINRSEAYWNAVEGVASTNPGAARPSEWLSTAGAFVRKGVWLGLPAVELGAGVVSLLESSLLSWQAYAKLALHEGFPRRPYPSVALRGAVAHLTGTSEVRLTTLAVDVIASKGFGVGGTFRVEPYVAWSFLRIQADSGLIDATPSCDAFRVRTSAPGQPLGEYCAEAQRGSDNDRLADFAFPRQSAIRRQRVSAGAKLKFATVFLTAQYEFFPVGRSRDGRRADGARDDSGKQQGIALSAGFDFH
jgi:hypothetical protein